MDYKLLENFCDTTSYYFKAYINLINSNLDTTYKKGETQLHHIIPKVYYKINNITIDNSKDNKVNLLYKDHILAHYYLYKSSVNEDFKCGNAAMLCIIDKELLNSLVGVDFDRLQADYNIIQKSVWSSKQYIENRIKALRKPETQQKRLESRKFYVISDYTRQKLSESHLNYKWYNDGVTNIMAKDCPAGFVQGKIGGRATGNYICFIDKESKSFKSLKDLYTYLYNISDNNYSALEYLWQNIKRNLSKNKEIYLNINDNNCKIIIQM